MILHILCLFSVNYKFNQHLNLITTELLLFTLLSLKSGLTLDLLGLMCGMDGSNVKRNQLIGLEISNL
jgi:hypothetical protein